METFKITCFAKLSVPALALGLPMDVLNTIGVLRLETPSAAVAAAASTPASKAAEKQDKEFHNDVPSAEGARLHGCNVGEKCMLGSSEEDNAIPEVAAALSALCGVST